MKNFKIEKYIKVIMCVLISVFSLPFLLCGCSVGDSDDMVMMLSENETSAYMEAESTGYDKNENMTLVSEKDKQICVYICGAVINPGVYEMEAGSRLYEAVEKAGGLTDNADGSYVNMARQMSDGEQVVILTCEETSELKKSGKEPWGEEQGAMCGASSLVNINTAGVSELTTVTGIGNSRAEAIIDYREANGNFTCIEDIKKVDGIKDGLFAKIKDKITVY